MALLNIHTYPDKVLTEMSKPVSEINEFITRLAEDMSETMLDAPGVGLAAPQVGFNVRMIVALHPDEFIDNENEDETEQVPPKSVTLINPVIISSEGEFISEDEGCLSVPDYRATVKRFNNVTVEAQNLDGSDVVYHAEGIFSVVLQHEIDHLDGKLFIDYISKLKREMVKKKLTKMKRKANE